MKSSLNSVSINGYEYNWGMIKIMINNSLTMSATAISYSETLESSNLYGLGNTPVARSIQNYTYEGSITLRKSDVIALQKAAYQFGSVDGSLPGLPFMTITVSFQRPNSNIFTTDVIRDVSILSNGVDVAQGDGEINVTLPILPGSIEWGQ